VIELGVRGSHNGAADDEAAPPATTLPKLSRMQSGSSFSRWRPSLLQGTHFRGRRHALQWCTPQKSLSLSLFRFDRVFWSDFIRFWGFEPGVQIQLCSKLA
jgi:hypothetical protein